MTSAATRETQASACLEAADRYREPLLALAHKLTGSQEGGMDLYQQTLLDCHDAIRRNGFAGDKYQFYLYTSLRNQFRKQGQRGAREVRVDFQAAESTSNSRNDEGSAPWAAQAHRQLTGHTASLGSGLAPTTDAYAELAEQVMQQVREQFSFADRVALRLHIDGLSLRDIAQHLGQHDHHPIWRRLEKMKQHLRQVFGQAYQALTDPAD